MRLLGWCLGDEGFCAVQPDAAVNKKRGINEWLNLTTRTLVAAGDGKLSDGTTSAPARPRRVDA
jgi:hypothetical protein